MADRREQPVGRDEAPDTGPRTGTLNERLKKLETMRFAEAEATVHDQEVLTRRLSALPSGALAVYIEGYPDPVTLHDARNKGEMILGRRSGNFKPAVDLLDHGAVEAGVSRQHAVITFVKDTFFIQDLSSTNGSWRNGSRLFPFRAHDLSPGDEIKLGNLRLRVYFHEAVSDVPRLVIAIRPRGVAPETQQLTPAYLLKVISPYLAALGELQNVLDDLLDRPRRHVQVRQISDSPLMVNLHGGADAIDLITSRVMPWQNVYAERVETIFRSLQEAADSSTQRSTGWFGINLRSRTPQPVENVPEDVQRSLDLLTEQCVMYLRPKLPATVRQAYASSLNTYIKILALTPLEIAVESKETPQKPR